MTERQAETARTCRHVVGTREGCALGMCNGTPTHGCGSCCACVQGCLQRERPFCPGCGRPDVTVGLDQALYETHPTFRSHACGVGGPGSSDTGIECQHEWLDRPESDTRECLICGTEVAG